MNTNWVLLHPLHFALLVALLVMVLHAVWRNRAFSNQQHTEVMSKLKDLAGNLATIETTLNKVKTEVEALKSSLEDVEIPADAQSALDRLGALSTALDNLNPDATPPA